jgi:hypothetical protein
MSKPSATAHRAAWWTVAIFLLIIGYFLSASPVYIIWARNKHPAPGDPEPGWLEGYMAPYRQLCRSYPSFREALRPYHDWCIRMNGAPLPND